MYPVVLFAALWVKTRDEATVRSKAVYLALAVLPDGTRDNLGLPTLQTCIVHLSRNSLDFANWKERKPLASALREIYTAPSESVHTQLRKIIKTSWKNADRRTDPMRSTTPHTQNLDTSIPLSRMYLPKLADRFPSRYDVVNH